MVKIVYTPRIAPELLDEVFTDKSRALGIASVSDWLELHYQANLITPDNGKKWTIEFPDECRALEFVLKHG